MNKLENQNLEQHIIHKSVPILLLKGGIAWLMLVIFDYFFDLVPQLGQTVTNGNPATFFSFSSFVNSQSVFHFFLNVLFGWLMLYVVLRWFYEYYVIGDDAIIVNHGIIFSHEDVYQMEDVKSIDVSQGFWGKLLGTGTVSFYAFRIRQNIYLSDVADPYAVAAHIHQHHPTPLGLSWPQNSKHHINPRNSGPVGTEAYDD